MMVITKLALSHILLQYNSIPILNPTERMLLKCVKEKTNKQNKYYEIKEAANIRENFLLW